MLLSYIVHNFLRLRAFLLHFNKSKVELGLGNYINSILQPPIPCIVFHIFWELALRLQVTHRLMHEDMTVSMCVLTRNMCRSPTSAFRRPPSLFTPNYFDQSTFSLNFSAVLKYSVSVNKPTWLSFTLETSTGKLYNTSVYTCISTYSIGFNIQH